MKSKCWLTMVCCAGMSGAGLIQQAGMYTRHRFGLKPMVGSMQRTRVWLPLHRLSKARNSIRLVLDRSHLWSSRMRGVKKYWPTRARNPWATEDDRKMAVASQRRQLKNNNEPPVPQEIFDSADELKNQGFCNTFS